MPGLALATCAALPDGDPDDAALMEAFRAKGVDARWAVWDDPQLDWSAFDGVLLRSTWDYSRRRAAFLTWARAAPRLINPPEPVRWNTDKRYLSELAAAGLAVVPTNFVAPGEQLPPDGGEVVVKPSVSAGSKDTARFPAGDARAAALARQIHGSGRTAMIQPYLDSVDARGEAALVFIDGGFSHAARKGPLLRSGAAPVGGLFAEEEIGAHEATDGERLLAERVIAWVSARFGAPAYARVDLVADQTGAPTLLELELTEPSLFFSQRPAAAEELARAVRARLG